jgi:hypothetical protein
MVVWAHLTDNESGIFLQYSSTMQTEEYSSSIFTSYCSIVKETFTTWMKTSELAQAVFEA